MNNRRAILRSSALACGTAIGVIAVTGCGVNPVPREAGQRPATDTIPGVVLDQYEAFSTEYRGQLGARLRFCARGPEAIYLVEGMSGYTIEERYYDADGAYLASHRTTDAAGDDPPSPVDLESFDCETLRESLTDPAS
jgi:hypothetical protein